MNLGKGGVYIHGKHESTQTRQLLEFAYYVCSEYTQVSPNPIVVGGDVGGRGKERSERGRMNK